MACCTTVSRSCCPLPPTVATPCLMDWTVAAYQAAVSGTVLIRIGNGNVLYTGFWVNGYSVITSWSAVGRESGVIRVIINVADSVPTSLDGVLTFAIPGFDLALISVNPNFFPPGYTPTVLPISPTCTTGEEVFVVTSPVNFMGQGSVFLEGYISVASYTGIGTITDVLTTLLFSGVGTPVIRKSDNAIVAMSSETNLVAVAGSIIRAFVSLAGGASAIGIPVTSAAYFPGALTYPKLGDNFALGIMKPAGVSSDGSATVSTAAVPLIAAGVVPYELSVGSPANGAIVYDPTVLLSGTPFGTLGLRTLSGGQVSPVSTGVTAFDAEYVRVPRPYSSIVGATNSHVCNADTTYFNTATGFFNVLGYLSGSYPTSKFVTSRTSSGVRYVANGITASASGFVSFTTTGFVPPVSSPEDFILIVNDPSLSYKYLYASPFAAQDFVLTDTSPSYYTNYGLPNGPLQLNILCSLASTTLTVTLEWNGYSLITGDPVSFQTVLVLAPPASIAAGQVTFNYGVLPGTWAGDAWLAGTQLTSNAATSTVQLIEIVDLPRMNESIYFGTAAVESSVVLPLSVENPLESSLLNRVVGPKRLPDGSLPGPAPNGCLVAYDEPNFYYAILPQCTWQATPIRIAGLNGSPIGTQALNVPSLTDAIIATNSIMGTPLHPRRFSSVTVVNVSVAAPVALTLAERNVIISKAYSLGTGLSVVNGALYSPSLSKFDWVPPATGYYASSLLYVQPRPYSREVYNYSSVNLTVQFTSTNLTSTGLIVIQLAAADSTSLNTQFADATSPSCAVIYYTMYGSVASYQIQYRSGYGGITVSTSSPVALAGSNNLSILLSYNTTAAFTQRPNVLVIGHPPRDGNGPTHSPYGSSAVPGILIPCTVEITSALVSDMRSNLSPVPSTDTEYAVTTERNVARPGAFNPV